MARAIINTPVKGFTGTVAGVVFTDGTGETDDEGAIAYFERQGYDVILPPEEPATAEVVEIEAPSEDWTVEQIDAFAAKWSIDLAGASKKGEKLAAIEAEIERRTAAAQASGVLQ